LNPSIQPKQIGVIEVKSYLIR